MGIHGWGGRNRPSLLETALNLLFPPRCVTCGTDGVWLCPACLDQVLFYEKPWPAFVADLWPMQGVRSAAHLSGPLRDALHHFKYGGLRALAGVLGEMLWDNWETDPWPAQVIVPVPLHRERLRERGYNQSVLLARELGRHTGLPVAEQTLRRVLATPPQVGLGAAERAEN
ncbi:MAG: ComF family protein, partial [Chloroflexi bacterium]|nr:ComF family protein [Chloroflexota bacterium]